MISVQTVRRWFWVHKWSSLVCTIFLLMLCLTGLPLIFHHELEHALGNFEHPAELPPDAPKLNLDRIVENALAEHPGRHVQVLFQEAGEPEIIFASLGKSPESPPDEAQGLMLDTRTGQVLGTHKFGDQPMDWLLKAHVEMFAGLPGKLFLGLMTALFLVAIVSGLVIYAPFMRERSFGVVRRHLTTRLRWLDLHNLLGISTAVWMLVVGATGMVNTWADLAIKMWQYTELSAMTAAYRGLPSLENPGSVQKAISTALAAEPGKQFAFVAFPRTLFSSPHHYAVFLRGDRPFTARLLKPVLVDAATGELTDRRELPWYVTAILVSQPLHFGDYGGLPLKIIWAVLDVVAILVLGSGVYLWWKRRKLPVEIEVRSGEIDLANRAAAR